MADQESILRDALAERYCYAARSGLNELSSGNLSVRLGNGMLISPSGASEHNLTPENLVKMDFEGNFKGRLAPSSEWQMHAAIYLRHEHCHAVVHTHSDYCVALSCHHRSLPGFHYLIGTFGGDDVPCTPYFTFGTKQLGDAAAEALEQRSACLLGSHGMICRATDIYEGVALAERLESCARQYYLACQMGEPRLLTEREWKDFFAQMKTLNYGAALK